ncbi:MAG: uroporphyrinogen decarboxylase [Thermoguttaceae bacterium]|nr:uroporphyrinogen decarboxylase [Thermoguttaceae bacterium]MDW8039051.1 uroporphyrinogen decarboxylase [Thermoguttaceae bacterium]
MTTCPAWEQSLLLKAIRREPTPYTPVWLMRQAGRYLPEYRALRSKIPFAQLCKTPSLCAQIMVQTVQRLGVDAAILFSDLLLVLEPMGFPVEYTAGEGPVFERPIRSAQEVDRLQELESLEPLAYVLEAMRLTRAALPNHIPLIGFAGAPFTLASYLIEGQGGSNFRYTKGLMYSDSGAWRAMMDRLARAVAQFLLAQIQAGAQAVQLFDTWAGCLGPEDYRQYVLPFSQAVIQAVESAAPVIHFSTGNPALLPLIREAGGQVIGVDWRVRLDQAWQQIGYDRAIQGNLDPAVLLGPPELIRQRVQQILCQAAGRAGHIFNLGHGLLPDTPVENVLILVDAVHQLSQRPTAASRIPSESVSLGSGSDQMPPELA